MAERVRLDSADGIPLGGRKIYDVAGQRLAVFNIAGTLHAIDDACPHRGAALSEGQCEGTTVTCPLHGWSFDVTTGGRVGASGAARVPRYEVFVHDGHLMVDLTPPVVEETGHRYLVRYGALGWVGWFGSVEAIQCGYRDFVLIQTSRGPEVGEILSGAGDRRGSASQEPIGDVLRCLTEREQADYRRRQPPQDRMDECRRRASERDLPVEIIDGETLFDGETMVLYYLGSPDSGLDELAEELSRDRAGRVILTPVIEPPAPVGGGCGSGGCGCHAD